MIDAETLEGNSFDSFTHSAAFLDIPYAAAQPVRDFR